MNYETISILIDDRGVAYVRLNVPEKRNAMSARMIAELTDLTSRAGQGGEMRVMVLGAEGPVFCAGGDLNWMRQQIDSDREGRMREARKLAHMLRALNEMPVPLIGRIHGSAFGGGVGLMCVCDHVIAAETAEFGLTETRLGIIPATIGPYVLARLGEGMARRIFMSARIFPAGEAREIGLVGETVPVDRIDEAVERHVRPYLSVAPGAVGAAKAFARSLGAPIDDAIIEASIGQLADIWETEEAREGIDAFLQKRPPRWARLS